MQLLFSFDQDMRVEKTLIQTLACKLSSTLMQLLFSFDQDTRVEKTLIHTLAPQLSSSFVRASNVSLYITDEAFKSCMWDKYGYKLSAANSINWGRLLPQVVYHASGYLDLVKQGEITFGEPIDICIPTGNFGNILAAFYAKVQKIQRLSCI